MRIAENKGLLSVSFGVRDDMEKEPKAKGKNMTIFAGDLKQNDNENAIEKKRKEIRQKATKVLQNKFEGDLKYGESLEESRARITAAQSDMKEMKDRITELEGYIENAPEELDEDTLRTYQEGLRDARAQYGEAMGTVIAENAGIRSARRAKLGERYEDSMSFAADQEEKILEAGSDEIMGIAASESMKHIDEMYEETIEKAEEAQEKKEEQEEKLDKIKENKEEIAHQVSAAKENAAEQQVETVEQVNDVVTKDTDMDRELRKLQKEAEVMDEDLKGLMVDSQL